MKNKTTTKITVQGSDIGILREKNTDYISLTDLAKYKNSNNPSDVIKKWMSNYDTIDFLGLWETLNNPDFNSAEFRRIKENSPQKSFTMTPNQWKTKINSLGIIPSKGKYSIGTYAHQDIALEFASWIDTSFKLYLIKEFQRLKNDEAYQNKIEWNVRRMLSKTNYRVHTDSVKTNLILPNLTKSQINHIYSNEADLLNVALFGMTASEYKNKYTNLEGNMRDNTDIEHLIVLSNLENLNAILIDNNTPQKDRLIQLNKIAKHQLLLFQDDTNIKKIKNAGIK